MEFYIVGFALELETTKKTFIHGNIHCLPKFQAIVKLSGCLDCSLANSALKHLKNLKRNSWRVLREYAKHYHYQVWVLTGDKEETAVNISYSAGHFRQGMTELRLTRIKDTEECTESMQNCIKA